MDIEILKEKNIDFILNIAGSIVEDYEKITIPPTPVREGFSFDGWYTETECTNIWNFSISPNIEDGHALVLYAGWNII